MDIDGSELNFRTPRMLCAKGRNETDLTALLRHIRNSFAHGRLYVKKTRRRNFICLEDLDLKRKLSAGICPYRHDIAVLENHHRWILPIGKHDLNNLL